MKRSTLVRAERQAQGAGVAAPELRQIRMALFGLGTVGSGVVLTLRQREEDLASRYGLRVILKHIVVREPSKKRLPEVEGLIDRSVITSDVDQVLRDPEVDVVVETIGGTDLPHRIALATLKEGKHFITANKALLGSRNASQIFRAAHNSNRYFGFRAAVTGCQEIVDRLSSALVGKLVGIVNGTCNYVLTRMEESGESFDAALSAAQASGYAESDPSLDIDGHDSADKLAILCRLSFGCSIYREDIPLVEGIRAIDADDIQFARELGYRIRLLAIAQRLSESKIEARVHPALVPANKILASMTGVQNTVQVHDELRGPSAVAGPGAGALPTASAIMADLLGLASLVPGRNLRVDATTAIPRYYPWPVRRVRLAGVNRIETMYYLRLTAKNRPGVLAKIAGVMGKNGINIMQVIQKGQPRQLETDVPVVIMTDVARELDVQRAIRKLSELDVVDRNVKIIRVEEDVL